MNQVAQSCFNATPAFKRTRCQHGCGYPIRVGDWIVARVDGFRHHHCPIPRKANVTTPIVATVKVSAVAEVRDKDGNLISAEPVSTEFGVTQQQLNELEGQD